MPKRILVSFLLGFASLAAAQGSSGTPTSGRPIPPGEACYDVLHYELSVSVDPEEKRIDGEVTMTARLLEPTDEIVMDLDDRLQVDRVSLVDAEDAEADLRYEHTKGEIRIGTKGASAIEPGGTFRIRVRYGGIPREAPNPPWDGGFQWAKTPSGAHWIATTNQMQGADLWWPCKDQPDDEPETMDIFVRVPAGLVGVSNGRPVGMVEDVDDGWTTWDWHVSTPINIYGVALDIAPYRTITRNYESTAGDTFPVTYWVIPEHYEKGKELFEDLLRQLRWFEETFGPYPFRRDKYGVVETPHLGMEQQTVTAYGNNYRGNPWGAERGFDFLLHHEMAHEWWANLVTARNWKDFWIHEGFATYAQALYAEALGGPEAYRGVIAEDRAGIKNRGPVAPREPQSTADVYFGPAGNDIYYKGALALHTLRYLLGDETFFRALRRMAYPDPELEGRTDGSACRFSDTEEIRRIAEEESGRDLGWFFEVYLRRAALPRLEAQRRGRELRLRWQAPDDLLFPMPVELEIDGERTRVAVPDGGAAVDLGSDGAELTIDPDQWILKENS
ncbi:MAG TPA: M1 family peptidase [Planctomycetes bacterium]|nr:M1 family peptidase [Planctomycetota bacterium]